MFINLLRFNEKLEKHLKTQLNIKTIENNAYFLQYNSFIYNHRFCLKFKVFFYKILIFIKVLSISKENYNNLK